TRSRPPISCDACKKSFLSLCISNTDILGVISTVPGLFWRCKNCIPNCIVINQDDVKNLLSGKIDETMASFKNQVTKLSADISRSMKSSHAVPSVNKPVVSYAEVVRNKTQPALIIQPKNGNHQSKQTKADLIQHVNPCTAEVQLAKVKDVRDGGILIGCKSKEENQKLKAIVQEKLSDSYVIREITGINPRFRLVGMSDKYSDDKLRHLLLKGNTDTFEDDFECKIVKHFPTKKDPSVYQAIVQVDRSSYEKIVKAGYLFVGYDSCAVYDAIDVYRCFKCNEFRHSSSKCKSAVVCPLCSENHEVKHCKSQTRKCSNCMKLKQKDGSVQTDHAVWDKLKCKAYNEALDRLRHDLLSQ
ncbi:unnamed protein product, partial [Acanthoscelides obtectus]